MKRYFFIFSLTLLCQMSFAADYAYTLRWLGAHTHTLVIELEITSGNEAFTDFKIPAWRPGRYYLQNYAASIYNFKAFGPDEAPLSWQKTDKDTWRVQHDAEAVIRIQYHYYANNQDAGSSYLGEGQVYFNPINCFMYVNGNYEGPVSLFVPDLPSDWKIATALNKGADQNMFEASSYHEFVDAPTVFSQQMKQLSFELQGVTFYLHFQGDYQGDAETDAAIIESVKKICLEQSVLFGGFPFETYHFIYRLLPFEMRHAVEHSNSASFALPARITKSPKHIVNGMSGITSHEFWHVWNVKRIRPAALVPYDYSQEQYTSLHWFTEGVTDYYTHLTLCRAGIKDKEYLYSQFTRTIQSLENNYASWVISPSQSSFDSWLSSSPYRHPDHGISYYTLGSRMGLILDLAIRKESNGQYSLDDVFNHLYAEQYLKGAGVAEDGIQKAMEELTQSSWQGFFDAFVHGTMQIPYDQFLEPVGLKLSMTQDKHLGSRKLGIISLDKRQDGYYVRKIHPGGDAARDGLSSGDLIIQVNEEASSLVDIENQVDQLEEGQSIDFTVIRGTNEQKISIVYKREYEPIRFQIEEVRNPSEQQKQLRADWLGSKQK